MGFSEFIGNDRTVTALRGLLASERIPHALLFSGPRGVGKYTLARMFAQAANCERRGPLNQPGLFAAAGPPLTDDFCGECSTCQQTARLADVAALVERGLEERGARPDTATVERVPLILQGHADVWALVPDPVRSKDPVARPVIRVGQLRAIQRAAYFRPTARRRIFIVDGADTMTAANSNLFLKVLEEPPESSTLILLTPNPYALLDTIRSRCMQFAFAPLATAQVEAMLAGRTKWKPAERKLAAELSGGSPGAALELDLAESAARRRDALRLIEQAAGKGKAADLFALTARLGKEEKDTFENLLEVLYSLLNDLLELAYSPRNCKLRNPDLCAELQALSPQTHLAWLLRAVAQLDELHLLARRNVGRSLGLEALVAALAGSAKPEAASRRP
jgi:DNA polymerase-3 subunit delta'